MFGLGKVHGLNRKEYNTRVKFILENRLNIDANHSSNSHFPGSIVFGQLLDEGWYQKACPEDNALYVALRYLVGCAKAGGTALDEARRINEPVLDFLKETAISGKISEARGRQFVMYYDNETLPYRL